MTTQPLKQILEQANLPWKAEQVPGADDLFEVTNSTRTLDWIGDSSKEVTSLIAHSVNNLSRQIENWKVIHEQAVAAIEASGPDHTNFPNLVAIEAMAETALQQLQTVQTP